MLGKVIMDMDVMGFEPTNELESGAALDRDETSGKLQAKTSSIPSFSFFGPMKAHAMKTTTWIW